MSSTEELKANDAKWPNPAYAWFVLLLLNLAYILAFVDRLIVGLLIDPIRIDLNLTDTQISLIGGAAFALFYSIIALPIGRIIDRTNRVFVLSLGIFLWSLTTAAAGLAQSFSQLFLARMGVGVGEAAIVPAGYSIISDYFPPQKLALAIGVFVMSAAMGAGLALIIGGTVIEILSGVDFSSIAFLSELKLWQLTLMAVGLPGIAVALLVLLIKEPVRRGSLKQAAQREGGANTISTTLLGFMKQHRGVYVPLIGGAACANIYVSCIFLWVPTFLSRIHGWSPEEVGTRFGLVLLTAGAAGALSGGFIATALMARGFKDGTVRVMIGALAIVFPLSIIAPFAPAFVSLLLFGLAFYFLAIAAATAPSALQLVTPNEMRGQVAAIFGLTINLVGLGAGPTSVALLTDYLFKDPQALGSSLAVVGGITAPVSVLILIVALRNFSQMMVTSKRWNS